MAFLKVTDGFELTVLALVVGTIILLVLALGMMAARGWRDLLDRYRARHLPRDERSLMEFIASGRPELLTGMTRTVALRNRIAGLAAACSGEERTKLMLAYTALGFTAGDFRRLRGRRWQSVARALLRCRELMVPIPNDGWRLLIHHRRPVFRWAAMEYLIAAKGPASLPWFMAFHVDPRNREQGVGLHLLACIASQDSRVLKFLLEHTDDPELVELVLRTMAHYPDPTAVDVILQRVRGDSPEETVIAAVRAIAAGPGEAAAAFLGRMLTHAHWVVRMYVARGLGAYFDGDALARLETLLTDPAYEVRRAAVESLFVLRPMSTRRLVRILEDRAHPAHTLVKDIEELQEKLVGV